MAFCCDHSKKQLLPFLFNEHGKEEHSQGRMCYCLPSGIEWSCISCTASTDSPTKFLWRACTTPDQVNGACGELFAFQALKTSAKHLTLESCFFSKLSSTSVEMCRDIPKTLHREGMQAPISSQKMASVNKSRWYKRKERNNH